MRPVQTTSTVQPAQPVDTHACGLVADVASHVFSAYFHLLTTVECQVEKETAMAIAPPTAPSSTAEWTRVYRSAGGEDDACEAAQGDEALHFMAGAKEWASWLTGCVDSHDLD